MQDLSDAVLVNLSQQGSEAAFGELARRHGRMMLRTALSVLRNWQEAEDEVQNSWCKAWQNIVRFEGESRFTTWMTRIVVNQCLMRLREERRARFLYLDEPPDAIDRKLLELPDDAPGPEQAFASRETDEVVRREVARVPPMLRRALLMRDIEERPMPEVARELGISLSAAKSRLLRGRIELRARLEKCCAGCARGA